MAILKRIEFETATVSRPISKYEILLKEESDKATIVDRDVKVSKSMGC